MFKNPQLYFVPLIALFISMNALNGQVNPCVSLNSYSIVVLGSSTAAGSGASASDSAWVNQYRNYLESINPGNQLINLAVGGYNTYRIMPTSFIPPPTRPTSDPARNITAALALNPDAIIVNMPSNDVASGYTYAEQMFNFDSIIATANLASVPIWICTTQPRNFSIAQQQLQSDIKDSIIAKYSPFVIDFWSTIALGDNSINPIYDSGDGIHLNDSGHALLFQRVEALNLLDQLFVASSITDVAALEINALDTTSCGDSLTTFEVIATNVGANDSLPVQIVFQSIHSPSGATFNDTLIVPTGLATCVLDTFNFTTSTYTAGTYSVLSIVSSISDTLLINDTTSLVLNIAGHPTLSSIDDTLCTPGAGTLSVIFDPQDTVLWYDDLINPIPIAFGSTFMTPWISTSTTWYTEVVRGNLYYSNELSTTNNSSINWNGAMFDIVAQNDLIVDSFEVKINTLGTQEVEIYTRPGSHLSYELNPSAWSYQGSVFVEVISSSEQTVVPLGNFPIATSDTLGVYIQMADPTSRLSYLNAGSAQSYWNSEMEIITGSGSSYNFGGSFYPRDWNGSVFYHYGSRLQGDCSTGRYEVTAHLGDLNFTLGQDTIIDILDTLTLAAPSGMLSYEWFDGFTAQNYELIASDMGTGIHFIYVQVMDSLMCIVSDTIIVAVADIVGIETLTFEHSAYPNPTSGVLNFTNHDIQSIDIHSATGRFIGSFPLLDGSIDLSRIPNGFYFIHIPGVKTKPIKVLKL
ncbi:MAG: lysophospholipase L1-like esterase [Flavobacteriaceae bacterium]|jgi:lysophospholipase L1-like esterase